MYRLYYDSPPADLLDYPDDFLDTRVLDLDADYEQRSEGGGQIKKKTKTGTKQLYEIVTDTQQRNFSAPKGLYGLYLSSYGPTPVNDQASHLMQEFSALNDGRDSEHNLDGAECRTDNVTATDTCYDGFACFHYGGTALSIDVRHIERDQLNVLRCLYQHEQGLLQKVSRLPFQFRNFLKKVILEIEK